MEHDSLLSKTIPQTILSTEIAYRCMWIEYLNLNFRVFEISVSCTKQFLARLLGIYASWSCITILYGRFLKLSRTSHVIAFFTVLVYRQ